MSRSVFHFKKFSISQEKSAMKVGTDAVLLGAWVEPGMYNRILDIGTGTAIIAIMLAQKTSALIDGVEIDEDSVIQAKENVKKCPWCDRINIYHISLQDFVKDNGKFQYDLIVSNPPYFQEASKPSSEKRIKTRHTDNTLTYADLISGVKSLLNVNGFFYLIMPLREGLIFKMKAAAEGIYCSKLTRVITKKGKPQKRLLLKFQKKLTECEEDELTILNDKNEYSKEYIELTKDYYLPDSLIQRK